MAELKQNPTESCSQVSLINKAVKCRLVIKMMASHTDSSGLIPVGDMLSYFSL